MTASKWLPTLATYAVRGFTNCYVAALQAEQQEHRCQLPGGSPRWPISAIRGFVGISGVYNCHGLADHLHRRGLYRSLFDRIMTINGKTELKLVSPTYCVKVRPLRSSYSTLVVFVIL